MRLRYIVWSLIASIAVAMLVLSRVLPGFQVDGWVPAILASLCLGAVNTILKPILFILTLPFTIVTLGLFLLVLNAMMLWITALIVPGFKVHGFFPALIASMILSIVSMIWKRLAKRQRLD